MLAWIAGLLAIILGLGASGALAWQHLTGKSLPGCGGQKDEALGTSLTGEASAAAAQPACATLEAQPMGSLGGMWTWVKGWRAGSPPEKILPEQAFWPVSYLGTAWFAGLLAAWLLVSARGRDVGGVLRNLVRVGALGSIVYLVVILVSRKYCQYCIATHVGSLALVAATEIGMLKIASIGIGRTLASGRRTPPWVLGAGAFVLTSAGLAYAEHGRQRQLALAHAKEFRESSEELLAKLEQDKAAAAKEAAKPKAEALPWGNEGFTLRWRLGPKEAKIRLVMLTDYQCPDCKHNEAQAMELYEKHPGKISISVGHFPLWPDCNEGAPTLHSNACWAARAAETAGLLGGNDGFWKMHKWLFEKGGSFTNDELTAGVKSLGFNDAAAFITIMQTDATLRPVHADVKVGDALGLYFTPLIFINGVEFRAWARRGALIEAVEAALAADPPVQGPQADRPMLAREKYIQDWRVMGEARIPPGRAERTLGKAGSKAVVVVFGDYSEPNTRNVDDLIRSWPAKGVTDFAYTFRHYPGDKACNPTLPKTFFPFGCAAARAAETAGVIAGPEGFWKMHAWLFANRERITSAAAVREGAASVGIDPQKLEGAMGAPEIDQAIKTDIDLAKSLGVGTIPAVYVNGKLVQRWARPNDNVLERIVFEAATGTPAP